MSTTDTKYHPEPYWSDVAKRIAGRSENSLIAGDDEPYYRYKRLRFLKMLHAISYTGHNVLEVGCGPGGNLLEVAIHQPASLTGVDISEDMIELARISLNDIPSNNGREPVELIKINGIELPFKEDHFDIVFTATVLQHNTNDEMHRQILNEICRVASKKVVLLERIETKLKGDELCLGRPLEQYNIICSKNGFEPESVEYINTRISYFVSGAIRKLFNKVGRREGEAISPIAHFLQRLTLPITRPLDKIFTSPTDVAKMIFIKKS